MSRTTVYTALAATGISTAHMAWPAGQAPSLPFCVFYSDEDSTFMADDSRYFENPVWTVELYEGSADETTEGTLETAIAAMGPFTRTEQWVESENCLMVVYRFRQLKG